MKALITFFKTPVQESVSLYWVLIKVMVPVMVLVRLAMEFGLIDTISLVFMPFMELIGLPAETGIVWTTAMLVNIYGGIAALITLLSQVDLNVAQMTILGLLMLMAHSLPVEQRIVQKSGPSLIFTTLLRIFSGLVIAGLAHLIFDTFDLLQRPATIVWAPETTGPLSWLEWALDSLQSLAMVYGIILVLLILLRLLDLMKITDLIARSLAPVLGKLGIGQKATPLAMVGVLLGLSYGGALILREAQKGEMSRKDIFLSLSFICLCHGLIEDTLLILALDADLTTILLGRCIFSFIVIYFLARVISIVPATFFERYLCQAYKK